MQFCEKEKNEIVENRTSLFAVSLVETGPAGGKRLSFPCRLPDHQPFSLRVSMNTMDSVSPFRARVCAIIKQAVGIWPAGAQRDALSELSQDLQAIEIYAGDIAPGETAANVAGRVITEFLYQV